MKSTFSFSRYVGTATAFVWTLGWAFTATHAINYWMCGGGGFALSNSIIPVAGTLLGIWTVFRIFPRDGRHTAVTSNALPPEPWHRRTFGWFALLVWCAVAIIWNLCVFHTTFLAATKGQLLLMVITVPFSFIGGFLLLMLFTAIGMFLDFLFQIKDATAPPVPGATPAPPPMLAQSTPRASHIETATDSDDPFFDKSPILVTLAVIAFINWFVFIGISMCLGGNAVGTLPSQDGYVLTSHGRHIAVSESTWVFSLYYSTATLLGFPLVFLLLGGKQFLLRPRKGKWYLKLLVAAFLVVWCTGWFGSIGHDFLTSRADWIHLKTQPATSRH